MSDSPRKTDASQKTTRSSNCRDIIPPLDFSFCDYVEYKDFETQEPRVDQLKKVKKTTKDGKSLANSLKFNNNALTNCKGLWELAEMLCCYPRDVAWLDLSSNEITTIDKEILEFESLKILYLHGNSISDLSQIDKLAGLPNLQKLTLHGNPIATQKNYKVYIMDKLPWLKFLDFSLCTNQDKKTTEVLSKFTAKPPKKKPIEED